MVCAQETPTCKWDVPGPNRTGYVVKDLLLDYYPPWPNATQHQAALLIVHGGAYWTGDKTDAPVVARAQYFASRGVATFSINYRLTGDQGMVPPDWQVNLELINHPLLYIKRALNIWIRDVFCSQHLGCRVPTVRTAPTKTRLESRFCKQRSSNPIAMMFFCFFPPGRTPTRTT